MMDKTDAFYRNRWWKRIQQSKRKFFYEQWRDEKNVSFSQLLKWIKEDAVYVVRWKVNILLQIRAYGFIIKKKYGVSLFTQFYRMMYVAFSLRHDPTNFRKYQLFKQENWKKVDRYVFFHTPSQREFTQCLFPEEADLFVNKFLFYEFCERNDFYTPPILALYEKGNCTYRFEDHSSLPKKDLFLKEMNGMKGWGARKLFYVNDLYADKDGKKYDEKAVYQYMKDYSLHENPVLLQEVLENDLSWQGFTSGALATCRIVTCRYPDSDKIESLFASLRMPTGHAEVDNFSSGGIAAPVNIKNGILGKAMGYKPTNGNFEFSSHPNTRQKIEGEILPAWPDLMNTALQLHKNVKSAFVGWDMCLTRRGICVIEGSLVWGSNVIETPHKTPLLDTNYPVLFEKWMEKADN